MAAEDPPRDDKEFRQLPQDEIEDMKTTFEAGNLEAVAKKLQKELEMSEKIPLHIAITGEAGSGKSTFVNAIRGLGDEDTGSAKTGEVETTMYPEPYPHPTLPNVTVWDLSGIGTPSFKPDQYLEQVSFQKYDFFIIITASRFSAHHTQLAQEIRKLGKRFYYVRSKVDVDLGAAQTRRPKSYSKEGKLQEIRNDCIRNLRKAGESSPWVFLLSGWQLAKYDFQLLLRVLEKELDVHKRQSFILSLPNISAEILEKKKAELKREIWKEAFLSGAISTVPIPGLSFAADTAKLVVNMKRYCQAFGLDPPALCRLAQQVGKPVEELKSVIKVVPLDSSINKETAHSASLKPTPHAARPTLDHMLD
ncbi:interferon-inducible GTPase 5-like [Alligator mississippiensis]|uniref:Interferon-inducible GTPase 5-like n=1 Tax=Alligator mississippiensis TaxID=8496 RepID=A0A151NR69_ALLMI|nr:interferon-inducible GTPase 5-like [Alligator mississippiensis]